jgi:hypothetical protein
MLHRIHSRALAVALALVCLAAIASPARAEGDLDKVCRSLSWLPADTAFYSVMLQNREQVQAVTQSRACARLGALPFVREMTRLAGEEMQKPNAPLAELARWYQAAENRELVRLLADMGSEEIFVYGGPNVIGFVDLVQQALGAVRVGPMFMQRPMRLSGEGRRDDDMQLRKKALFHALAESKELIKAPEIVIGFKIRDKAPAEAQLARLETVLHQVLAAHAPVLEKRLKRTQIDGGNFLTLELDGSLVPWDRVGIEDEDDRPEGYDEVIQRLKSLKLPVQVGVRDGFVFIALAVAPERLARPAAGPRLASIREFQPLARFADRRLASVDYASQALRRQASASKQDVDAWMEAASSYLPKIGFPEETQKRIQADLENLAKDLKSLIPEVGAALAFSFLTEDGSENYSYDYGKHAEADGSRPLSLLQHVGGDPVVALVSRSKPAPERYRMLVKWLAKARGYFEELALPLLGERVREPYEEYSRALTPLLHRLDETTATKLLPAFADGQGGFVLDTRLTSKRWYVGMPQADTPLPMLEPAFVFGISDAELLRQAFRDYRKIFNDLIVELRKLGVPNVPPIALPEPQAKTVSSGTIYYYPFPLAFFGVDVQIAPAAGLSKDTLVLTLSHAHAERLLKSTPLAPSTGPLADPNRPLAGAAYVNWPRLVDAITVWVDYGFKHGVFEALGPPPADAEKLGLEGEELEEQAHTVLEVLKVFRGYTSGTYLEAGALVTHGRSVFKDVPAKDGQ